VEDEGVMPIREEDEVRSSWRLLALPCLLSVGVTVVVSCSLTRSFTRSAPISLQYLELELELELCLHPIADSLTSALPHFLTSSLLHFLTSSLPHFLTSSLTHSLTHSLTRLTWMDKSLSFLHSRCNVKANCNIGEL
jgi:hypothetical protein